MYTLRQIPADPRSDARGLTLDEAFVRMMGLTGRAYRFTRTGWAMQLLLTEPPGDVDFLSHATNDAIARQDIKRQVCQHGLGAFTLMTDAEYANQSAGEKLAAE